MVFFFFKATDYNVPQFLPDLHPILGAHPVSFHPVTMFHFIPHLILDLYLINYPCQNVVLSCF